jgi:8-oxo-dGTP diphosphatase
VLLVDGNGYVTIREPANHFDGYEWSHAKGRIERDETEERRHRVSSNP